MVNLSKNSAKPAPRKGKGLVVAIIIIVVVAVAAAAFYFLAWPVICRNLAAKAVANHDWSSAGSYYSMANEKELADNYFNLSFAAYQPSDTTFTRAEIDYSGSEDCNPVVFYRESMTNERKSYEIMGVGHEPWALDRMMDVHDIHVIRGYGHMLIRFDGAWHLLNSVTGKTTQLSTLKPSVEASKGFLRLSFGYGMIAYYNADGRRLPGTFHDGHHFKNGYAAVAQKHSLDGVRWGIIDAQGNTIFPCEYHSTGVYGDNLFHLETNGKFRLVNINGKSVMPGTYSSIKATTGEYVILEQDGKYGVIDLDCNTIIPIEFESIRYENDAYFIIRHNGKYGIFDTDLNMCVPIKYESLDVCEVTNARASRDDAHKKFFVFKENRKYGLVCTDGRVIVPAMAEYDFYITINAATREIQVKESANSNIYRYDLEGNPKPTHVVKRIDGNQLILDPDGNAVLNLTETRLADSALTSHSAVFNHMKLAAPVRENVAVLSANSLYISNGSKNIDVSGFCIVNLDGKVLHDLTVVEGPSSGVRVSDNGVICYYPTYSIAYKGELVQITEDEARVLRPADGIREDGSVLAGDFHDGLARVWRDGKFGFINEQGEYVVTPQYNWAEEFSEGYAVVRLNGLYGYIDTTGAVVIKPQYTYAESFTNQMAVVALADSVPTSGNRAAFSIPKTMTPETVYPVGTMALIDPSGNMLIKGAFEISIYDDLVRVCSISKDNSLSNAIYTIDLQRIF